MAIVRRMKYGKKIIVGDMKSEHTGAVADIMNAAGFDVLSAEMDLASKSSIRAAIPEAHKQVISRAPMWRNC